MTLGELDEVLKVWKSRLASIAENLMDLQSESAYRSLTGTGGLTKIEVTGATAARVKPALGAMHTMFEQFGLLQGVVDQAETLRRELPAFFGGDAKAREIQRLLFGPSIQLSAVNIPLEQRTLLGGIRSEQRMTPEELLGPMERSFAAARDAVMGVERAWTEFATNSTRVEAELARLREQKALPSALLTPSLQAVEATLQTVRVHVQTDPLGAEGELRSAVDPILADLQRRVEAAVQLATALHGARARCDELISVHRSAAHALAEAEDKVVARGALPAMESDVKVQGLQDWLQRLEHKHAEGAVDAVAVGLRHWNMAVDACVLQDRKVQQAARTCVEQRSELRGRFDALKAKARRFGLAESDGLAELVGRAEALLYSRPTDLRSAGAALASFEDKLRGMGREA